MKKSLKFRVCRHTLSYTSGFNVWYCRLFVGQTNFILQACLSLFDFHTNVRDRACLTPSRCQTGIVGNIYLAEYKTWPKRNHGTEVMRGL